MIDYNDNDMPKDPAFLFYPGDYVAGTMYLDFECKGAYVDLLMLQFNKGHMTIHMIQQVLRHRFDHIWPHISDKFKEKEGLYWNERLRIEKEKRSNFCESRRSNKLGSLHMTDHMTDRMEDRDVNEDLNKKEIKKSFEEFWSLYDKKVGDKDKLLKKWEAIKQSDKEKIMAYIPLYKAAQPDKKYRLHPATFFNNKSWNDEIISSQKGVNGKVNNGSYSGGLLPNGQDATRIDREGAGKL